MNGEYKEKLSRSIGGGDFTVTKHGWHIRYYFSGPDARYNGTFFTINGSDIEEYIDGYLEGWKEYQSLYNTIPEGASFKKDGKKTLAICVAKDKYKLRNGICIDGWHMPISTKEGVTEIVTAFRTCKERAPAIMNWLRSN